MNQQKTCQRCGRGIEWRAKWKRNWDEIKYCSAACRKSPRHDPSMALREAILSLLRFRPRDSSICPSEAARTAAPDSWRELMEPTRRAARLLAADGQIEITQGNQPVDPSTAKGPIRLRRGPRFPESI